MAALLWLLALLAAGFQSAFFSLNPQQINSLHGAFAEEGRFPKLYGFMQKPKLVYSTLHLVQFGGIIGGAALVLRTCWQLQNELGNPWPWLALAFVGSSLLLYLVLEHWLRLYAARHRMGYLRSWAGWVQVQLILLYPLSYVYRLGLQLLQRSAPQAVLASGAERLQEAIQQQREEDSPEEEKAILKALVNLGGITVKNILRARVEVKALDIESTPEEVLTAVTTYGYSRLPVYRDSLDAIEGILYVKDLLPLLGRTESAEWQKFLRPAYFVPPTKKIQRLLKEFQEKHLHIAVVTDEYGGTAGIVTLHDILEEIFGDIRDEFDHHGIQLQQLPDGSYLLDGRTSLLDFAKLVELSDESLETLRGDGDHETLGGLLLAHTGEIPAQGYTLLLANIQFQVHAVTPNAIRQVRVTLPLAPKDVD